MKQFNQKLVIAAVMLLGSATATTQAQINMSTQTTHLFEAAKSTITSASRKIVALSAAGCPAASEATKLAKKIPAFLTANGDTIQEILLVYAGLAGITGSLYLCKKFDVFNHLKQSKILKQATTAGTRGLEILGFFKAKNYVTHSLKKLWTKTERIRELSIILTIISSLLVGTVIIVPAVVLAATLINPFLGIAMGCIMIPPAATVAIGTLVVTALTLAG